jgi:hypothetical protein
MQTLSLIFNCLGAFTGTTHSFGLMFFTFKLLPSDKEVPTTGAFHQLLSKEKAKVSLRPLAEAEADWAFAMFLLSLLEEAMVFLFLLADLLLCLTFSVSFLHAGRGGAKKVTKALL